VCVAGAESMAAVYPAARNLCAAVTYTRSRNCCPVVQTRRSTTRGGGQIHLLVSKLESTRDRLRPAPKFGAARRKVVFLCVVLLPVSVAQKILYMKNHLTGGPRFPLYREVVTNRHTLHALAPDWHSSIPCQPVY